MSVDFVGRNGVKFNLGDDGVLAISAVLAGLRGKKVELGVSSESDCKAWAAALRSNISRIRQINDRYHVFLAVEGTDLDAVLSSGLYKHSRYETKPNWMMAKPLDDDWRGTYHGVCEFSQYLRRNQEGGVVSTWNFEWPPLTWSGRESIFEARASRLGLGMARDSGVTRRGWVLRRPRCSTRA